MIRLLSTTALVAACAGAALSTTATAAPHRGTVWYECVGGWQPNQCVKSGMTPNTARARQIVFIPPPPKKPDPDPKVPRFEIHPEGNGAVSGGGGGAGGGGGGGGGGR